ncbi:MAG: type I secretion system permease/ATPase, partial [Sneathiella sp.]
MTENTSKDNLASEGHIHDSSSASQKQPPVENWDIRVSDISRADHDPLLGCLVAITKIFDDPRTADALIYGLPLEDHRLTPQLFVRAAQRVGLSARMTNRKLSKIPDVVLPSVLLLNERRACILLEVKDNQAVVIFPESGEGSQTIAMS